MYFGPGSNRKRVPVHKKYPIEILRLFHSNGGLCTLLDEGFCFVGLRHTKTRKSVRYSQTSPLVDFTKHFRRKDQSQFIFKWLGSLRA